MKVTKSQLWIVGGGLLVLLILVWVYYKYYKKDGFSYCEECAHDVGSEHMGDHKLSPKTETLLPIMTPEFNFREASKQMLLLEDHLFNWGKRCKDCIKKHFLTIEGLLEEAISLDTENKYTSITHDYPDKIREVQRQYLASEDPVKVARSLRVLRKPLHTFFFDKIFDQKDTTGSCGATSSCGVGV